MDFHARMTETLARRRAQDRRLKGMLLCLLLMACAWIACGFLCREDVEQVQEVYTVKEGDTLRDISQRYLARNTGSSSYILAFEQGIRENNPWLEERHGQLLPGDRLIICYKARKEK